MKVNKEELQKALEIVKPGLANKELIEQSTSFAFIKGRVVTYNDEISISHPIKGLDLDGAILADNLYKFLGKIKKDDLELTIENNEIVLTTGKAKAGLVLQSEIKLPLDEEIAIEGKWHPLPENFVERIKFVMTACSRDMSQPVLTCVHVNKEGFVEASDGFRVAKYELGVDMPVDTFLIPASAVVDMTRLKPIRISEGKGWIHFRTREGTIISCRIYKDKFPETSALLAIKGTRLLLPDTIKEVLDRAMIFAKRDHILDESVIITMKDKKFMVKAESDSAWFKEEVDTPYNGEPIEFIITPYLLKGIVSETQAGILSGSKLKFEGDGWVYLTMLRG